MGLDPIDSEVVAQDVFITVYRSLPSFDDSRPEGFRGWIWTITKRTMYDHLRERRRSVSLRDSNLQLSDIADARSEANAKLKEIQDEVSTLIAQAKASIRSGVDGRTWEMFKLVMSNEMEPREIAESLGVSRGTVYKARVRALKKLRENVKDLLVE